MDTKDLMSFEELNTYMRTHERLINGTKEYAAMHYYSGEAGKITAELNTGYHTPEERIEILSKLTGKKISDTYSLFPPFYSDYGKNIELGDAIVLPAGTPVAIRPTEIIVNRAKEENGSIKKRIEDKEKLLAEYDKLMEERNSLIAREQKLDEEIAAKITQLSSMQKEEGSSYGRK